MTSGTATSSAFAVTPISGMPPGARPSIVAAGGRPVAAASA